MTDNVTLLISGMTVGVIIFQTAIVAPSVFESLSSDDSSIFLRKVFPKFFILIGALGVISNLVAVTNQDDHAVMVSGATVALAVFAYLLIPMTNKSRDAGNEKAFKRLHLGSVLLTLTILGVNLSGLVL